MCYVWYTGLPVRTVRTVRYWFSPSLELPPAPRAIGQCPSADCEADPCLVVTLAWPAFPHDTLGALSSSPPSSSSYSDRRYVAQPNPSSGSQYVCVLLMFHLGREIKCYFWKVAACRALEVEALYR